MSEVSPDGSSTRRERRYGLPLSALDRIVVAATEDAKQLTRRTVLVTGATGFFGRWLVGALLALDDALDLRLDLLCLSRDPGRFLQKEPELRDARIQWISGDIRHFSLPNEPLHDLVHLATPTSARQNAQDPLETFLLGVDGMRHVVDVVRERGAERLLLASTGAVYGPQPRELARLTEDYSGAPNPMDSMAAYALAKRAAEALGALEAVQGHLTFLIARCFAFAGPHLPLDEHFAFGNFVRDALSGKDIEVTGDGTPLRSYLEAEELVCWLLRILVRGRSRRPYNVGSERPVSIRELADRIACRGGVGVRVLGQPQEGLPTRYVPSVERVRRELGLVQQRGLDDAIDQMFCWAEESK